MTDKKPKEKMKICSINLLKEEVEKINDLANEECMSISAFIRRLIKKEIKRVEETTKLNKQ